MATSIKTSRMARSAGGMLGFATDDAVKLVGQVRAGIPFRLLAQFQKQTELSWVEVGKLVGIPQRTISRRQSEGRLQPAESDRVLRASRIFDMAVELFEGDEATARKWLRTPHASLAGETPLEFANTEAGAREVERLIGRLEHGVFV